ISGQSAGGGLGRSFEVVAKSSGIHVLHNDMGELALNVDLHGTGSVLAPHIEGTIAIDRGRLEVDKLIDRLTKNAYQPAEAPAAPAPPPEVGPPGQTPPAPPEPGRFSQASMDVNIRIPDNLVLRGRSIKTSGGSMGLGDVNLTAGGNVRVTKAP